MGLGVDQRQAGPQEPPNTAQRSILSASRIRSMSATRSQVVLFSTTALGVERPQPRWSKRMIRSAGRRSAASPGSAAAGTAVQHHHRGAVGAAALLDVDPVAAGHLHHLLAERLDRA